MSPRSRLFDKARENPRPLAALVVEFAEDQAHEGADLADHGGPDEFFLV
jgi:hypothetical protein